MTAGTDIFISHKRQERELARAYAEAFRAKGFLVVTDLNIPHGTDFGDVIDAMIKEAALVVVLWTPGSAESDYVRKEAREAQVKGKYFGVRAKPVERDALPFELRDIQYQDVADMSVKGGISAVLGPASEMVRKNKEESRKAETRTETMSADMNLYATVHSIRELSGYRQYLDRFPTGIYREEAQKRIDEITRWSSRLRRYFSSPGALLSTTVGLIAALAALWTALTPPAAEQALREITRLANKNDALEEQLERIDKRGDELSEQLGEAREYTTELEGHNAELLDQIGQLEKELASLPLPARSADETNEEAFDAAKRLRKRALAQHGCTTDQGAAGVLIIEECQDLATKKLTLNKTGISDLAPVSALTNLTELKLWDTQVEDLTPLQSLASLQSLDLTGTKVTDLAPLGGLSALKYLYLDRTPVSDLGPLRNLKGLQRLDLSGSRVRSLAPLEGLQNLFWMKLPDGQDSGNYTNKTEEALIHVQEKIRSWEP